jgi:hypothetical protein
LLHERASWRIALENVIHGVPFNAFIAVAIVFNLVVIFVELAEGTVPWTATSNYIWLESFLTYFCVACNFKVVCYFFQV